MCKTLIIALILAFTCPSVFAAWPDNRAIRQSGFPDDISNTAATTEGAFGAANQYVCVVNTLTATTALSDSTRNGTSVKQGGFVSCVQWDTDGKLIIFEKSGEIVVNDRIYQNNNYVSILGQTAPDEGVFFKGLTLLSYGEHCVYQHIRPFANNSSVTEGNQDGINVYGCNTIVDHCTIGWTDDENLGIGPRLNHLNFDGPDGNGEYTISMLTEPGTMYRSETSELTEGTIGSLDTDEWAWSGGVLYLGFDPTSYVPIMRDFLHNIIISNNIIAEGLQQSNTNNLSDSNSKGCLVGDTRDVLFYKNLWIHNHYRNPWINSGTSAAVINNWIANPANDATDALGFTEDTASGQYNYITVVGNVFDNGHATSVIYAKGDIGDSNDINASSLYYFDDQLIDGVAGNDSTWAYVSCIANSYSNGSTLKAAHEDGTPPPIAYGFTALAATAVAASIEDSVGAFPDNRSDIETRLVNDAKNETGSLADEADLTNTGSFPNWPGTGAEGFEVSALTESTRNVGTGMVAAGFVNMPDLSTDTDADGRVDWLELFLDPITEDVEGVTPASPPASSSNITGVTPVGVTIQ